MTPPGTLVERWRRFWFEEIPPHSYALIRILIGVVGALTIIGAWNPAFWQVDGHHAARRRVAFVAVAHRARTWRHRRA